MTFFLLIAALAVWGIIVYKMVSSAYPGETCLSVASSPAAGKIMQQEVLNLAYPDPFLRGTAVPGRKSACGNNPAMEKKVTEVPMPSFRLKGKISKKQQKFLLLEYEGNLALYPYDSLPEGYAVRGVYADSVVVACQGQCYTLYMEK